MQTSRMLTVWLWAVLALALVTSTSYAQFGPLDPNNPFSEYNRIDGRLNPNNPFSEFNRLDGSLNPHNPFSEINRLDGRYNSSVHRTPGPR